MNWLWFESKVTIQSNKPLKCKIKRFALFPYNWNCFVRQIESVFEMRNCIIVQILSVQMSLFYECLLCVCWILEKFSLRWTVNCARLTYQKSYVRNWMTWLWLFISCVIFNFFFFGWLNNFFISIFFFNFRFFNISFKYIACVLRC